MFVSSPSILTPQLRSHGLRSIARLLYSQQNVGNFEPTTTLFRPSLPSTRRMKHTLAITRDIPSSLSHALSRRNDDNNTINVDRARRQHKLYVHALQSLVYGVSLPSNERYPDCVFVEDTIVVVDKHAVITRIGATSRQGEVEDMKRLLLNMAASRFSNSSQDESSSSLSVTDMREVCNVATCDGGDVLYPNNGRHMFVGMSSRTNSEAVSVLQRAFPKLQIIPVDMSELDALHLKSIVTHVDGSTLLAPVGEIGDVVLSRMKPDDYGYNVVRLLDPRVCNVVSLNGTILAHATDCEETKRTLEHAVIKERGMELKYLEMDELEKCDGALTCGSVLLNV